MFMDFHKNDTLKNKKADINLLAPCKFCRA